MSLVLTSQEARVIGALIEKDMATPEYYPLSLHALVNACNQKTNREPVTSYDEGTVESALASLREKYLVSVLSGAGHRVVKYRHRASETLNVNNPELAVVSVLLLRGAQTLNEIKTRSESLHKFDDEASVRGVLERLAERGMTVLLARHPGTREARWTHLLTSEPRPSGSGGSVASEPRPPGSGSDELGVARESLVDRVSRLEAEVADLKASFAQFRKQLP